MFPFLRSSAKLFLDWECYDRILRTKLFSKLEAKEFWFLNVFFTLNYLDIFPNSSNHS